MMEQHLFFLPSIMLTLQKLETTNYFLHFVFLAKDDNKHNVKRIYFVRKEGAECKCSANRCKEQITFAQVLVMV